ncbi:MAG: hypothetical protein ACOYEO_07495 [bacterium]
MNARILNEHNIATHYPIDVVGVIEEGGRFGGALFASWVWAVGP